MIFINIVTSFDIEAIAVAWIDICIPEMSQKLSPLKQGLLIPVPTTRAVRYLVKSILNRPKSWKELEGHRGREQKKVLQDWTKNIGEWNCGLHFQ